MKAPASSTGYSVLKLIFLIFMTMSFKNVSMCQSRRYINDHGAVQSPHLLSPAHCWRSHFLELSSLLLQISSMNFTSNNKSCPLDY